MNLISMWNFNPRLLINRYVRILFLLKNINFENSSSSHFNAVLTLKVKLSFRDSLIVTTKITTVVMIVILGNYVTML